jgi:hypothetical protein
MDPGTKTSNERTPSRVTEGKKAKQRRRVGTILVCTCISPAVSFLSWREGACREKGYQKFAPAGTYVDTPEAIPSPLTGQLSSSTSQAKTSARN